MVFSFSSRIQKALRLSARIVLPGTDRVIRSRVERKPFLQAPS
jgi:hypothetical protein